MTPQDVRDTIRNIGCLSIEGAKKVFHGVHPDDCKRLETAAEEVGGWEKVPEILSRIDKSLEDPSSSIMETSSELRDGVAAFIIAMAASCKMKNLEISLEKMNL